MGDESLSFNPECEMPACLCEDCGGMFQTSADDLTPTYIHAPIRSEARIMNLCVHCLELRSANRVLNRLLESRCTDFRRE